ncbi:hypothetical protein JCM21714_2206 [Gracilibacillus boraciitolerans JCM 21714]|uniref:DUF421 domain-containing protein n=1 Tax=Gracilibacillus boraciitolerans JCM 21714 TaxID=1298598 RepID=W4VIB7_9BACI|nr:DUF421 domain-containing protein [Gracilibacillus boraciitolerans]GAE93155.1 hypothetical protein JCM21714_2206 [Gracilibacillus boraciitolerans JCM 21714]
MPDWLDIAVRVILFIIILFLLTKLSGKKQLSELSFFEYVSGITIGSIAAEVIINTDNRVWHGIIGICVFALFIYLVEIASLHSKKFRDYVEGSGTVIIKDGKVLEDNMKKEKYTTDELLQLLRGKDIFDLSEVEYAVLEAKGSLSVLPKKDFRPITRKDLGLPSVNEKEPYTVIMDGEILDEALTTTGKNRAWLQAELDTQNITIENVFLGQIDTYGTLSIDLFDDKIQVPTPQERPPLMLAHLKKCQADLELFALATKSESAKNMYAKNAKKLDESMQKLLPFLKD